LVLAATLATTVYVKLITFPTPAISQASGSQRSAQVVATPLLPATFEPPFAKDYRRPSSVPYPDDNAFTPARQELGRQLFFDPRLSGSGVMSCATCHNPSFDYGDGLPKAIGHGHHQLGRRTPTVLNLAWAELLFWDGRAGSLEEQALGPIQSAGEMNMDLGVMESKIRQVEGYQPLFAAAYPNEPIDRHTIAKAIATFERSVVSAKSPFDAYIAGDQNAISPSARRGFELFNTKANCMSCHSGWSFTDYGFHDIGVADADEGRFVRLPLPSMKHAFKTPTLRYVDRRAPFMHDGSEKTLEDVVEFYDAGGRVKRESVSPDIRPLNLTTDEKKDLVEFLRTLTSPDPEIPVPTLPR
jgi:cytochrome c peroxidase